MTPDTLAMGMIRHMQTMVSEQEAFVLVSMMAGGEYLAATLWKGKVLFMICPEEEGREPTIPGAVVVTVLCPDGVRFGWQYAMLSPGGDA